MRIAFSDEAFAQLHALTPVQRKSVTNLIRAIQGNPNAGWYYYTNPRGEIVRIAPGMHVDLVYLVSWEVSDGMILIAAIITFPFPSLSEYEEDRQP